MARYPGQGAADIRQILPAAGIVGKPMREARDCLLRLRRLR